LHSRLSVVSFKSTTFAAAWPAGLLRSVFTVTMHTIALLAGSSLSLLSSGLAQSVAVSVPSSAPTSAVAVSQSLVSFSIEQDRWTDWIGTDSPNTFWLNALNNLKRLSGAPTRIRIGADSEDHTQFSKSVQVNILLSEWPFDTAVRS
jgi:hypothetical protein